MEPNTYTRAMELLADARTLARLADSDGVGASQEKKYRERERRCRLKALLLLSDPA